MTVCPAFDLALAVEFLKRAYQDEAAGRDPLANYKRSRAAVAPADAFVALGLCVDALLRATEGDPDQLVEALWLDGELAADADILATGAVEQ
ncbi:MAG: hypothetical protein ACLQAN_08735 [Acidimicrobiales bacterium]